MGFQTFIHNLDEFFHSGTAIATTTDKLTAIADNISNNLDSVCAKLNTLITVTTKDAQAFEDEVPEIAQNVNTSIIKVNDILHWMAIAIIFSMILCCFCCLLCSCSTYHNIFGIKKVEIVKSSKKCIDIDSDIEQDQIIKNNKLNDTESTQLDVSHVTIDIPKAGSTPT